MALYDDAAEVLQPSKLITIDINLLIISYESYELYALVCTRVPAYLPRVFVGRQTRQLFLSDIGQPILRSCHLNDMIVRERKPPGRLVVPRVPNAMYDGRWRIFILASFSPDWFGRRRAYDVHDVQE